MYKDPTKKVGFGRLRYTSVLMYALSRCLRATVWKGSVGWRAPRLHCSRVWGLGLSGFRVLGFRVLGF